MAVSQKLQFASAVYVDINTNYGNQKGLSGILVTDIDAINNEMFNLLSTAMGDADYEPTLYGLLDVYLFEQNSQETLDQIYDLLQSVLMRWLSQRIYVTPNSFIATIDKPNRLVNLTVTYTYLRLNVSVRTIMNIKVPS